MYRSYEDPWKLEDELAEMKAEYEDAQQDPDINLEELMDRAQEITEMEERIRFAWDDQEYDLEFDE